MRCAVFIRRPTLLVATVSSLCLVVGCGSASGNVLDEGEDALVLSVSLGPDSVMMAVGDSVLFEASVFAPVSMRPSLNWFIRDQSVGTLVDQIGPVVRPYTVNFEAKTVGTTYVVAILGDTAARDSAIVIVQ